MDVELQLLKHLKRDARPTISIIERYCSADNGLFSEAISYEQWKDNLLDVFRQCSHGQQCFCFFKAIATRSLRNF